MRLKLIVVVAVGCWLLLAGGCNGLPHERELAHREDCLSALRSTGWALVLYCQENDGKLPENFSLLSNLVGRASLYVCPWNRQPPGSWTNIEDWMDYFYIPWPKLTGGCTNYPLLYDRRLANHGGKGINILLVEQVVHSAVPTEPQTFHGQFFWDEDAKWLRKFAHEHPDLKIPMPEDLK
jgi:hypothetical protein